MLPDYVSLKRHILTERNAELRNVERAESLLSLAHHIRHHEGDRFTIVRSNGSVSEGQYRQFEIEGTLKISDLLASGSQAIRDFFATMSERLAKQQSSVFQELIEESTEQAGTVTHAKGRPFSAELYIEALEPVEFDFDENEQWIRHTLVFHPDHLPRVKRELARLDNEPALQGRLNALIERKRSEWRAREANRTLAD
jgi:hypothetical protein